MGPGTRIIERQKLIRLDLTKPSWEIQIQVKLDNENITWTAKLAHRLMGIDWNRCDRHQSLDLALTK